jgi:hypothetical protein
MTGRGAGYCSGAGMPGGFAGFGGGRGFGRGMGRGSRFCAGGFNGRRNFAGMGGTGFAPLTNPDPEFEKQILKRQADSLQAELESIRKRLSEME